MSYLTDERTMIQQTARDFTMNEVLPIANKLDPVEGEIPMELRAKMADLGYFRDSDPRRIRRVGAGRVRIRVSDRGAGARLDERRQHHRPR